MSDINNQKSKIAGKISKVNNYQTNTTTTNQNSSNETKKKSCGCKKPRKGG